MVGILDPNESLDSYVGSTSGGYSHSQDAKKYNNGSNSSYGTSFSTGDVISVAFDADAGTLIFYKNGVSQGTAFSSIPSGTYLPATSLGNTMSATINHGARAFAYAAPSGYKALCTANLPTPTIADGSEYFDTKLWTGNGSTQSITGLEFSPDLVWIKMRSAAAGHRLYDAVRGATKFLVPQGTDAEATQSAGLTSFDSAGFSLGSNFDHNNSSSTFVGWAWDAGSSTASNTDGSITASVRANQTAGFSIVAYSGSGGTSTVGHGLNVKPSLVIIKSRSGSSHFWIVGHSALSSNEVLYLNTDIAAEDITSENHGGVDLVNSTSSTVKLLAGQQSADSVNRSGENFIAYCFAPVAGYSAFGSYEGNGSTDGPFVHLGFKPSWIIIKNSSATENWYILDTTRDESNVSGTQLKANTSDAEDSFSLLDLLSNGFKIRNSNASYNTNGSTYVWGAFAENPFQANGGLAR
jgi:hypothetical protein